MFASSFATSNVHDQLKSQQITMPAGAALTSPEMKAQLGQYAGQEMTTGAQAKAFADYYVQAHMNAQADGKTYSQISSEYMAASKADPTAQATQDLGALRQSLFIGHHAARHAPQRLRLRHPGHHRDVGRHRRLRQLPP